MDERGSKTMLGGHSTSHRNKATTTNKYEATTSSRHARSGPYGRTFIARLWAEIIYGEISLTPPSRGGEACRRRSTSTSWSERNPHVSYLRLFQWAEGNPHSSLNTEPSPALDKPNPAQTSRSTSKDLLIPTNTVQPSFPIISFSHPSFASSSTSLPLATRRGFQDPHPTHHST